MSKCINQDFNIGKISKILYRSSCRDGFGGAYAFWQFLGTTNRDGAKVDYTPVKKLHSEEYIADLKGKFVVYIGFCEDDELMMRVYESVNGLLILNSKYSDMEFTPEVRACIVTDSNKSGATLAWNFCFPGRDPPQFFKFLEDKYLKRFSLEETEAFMMAIENIHLEFEKYASFEEDENLVRQTIKTGKSLLSYRGNQIEESLYTSVMTKFLGYDIMVCNSIFHCKLLGKIMACKPDVDFSVVWNYDHQEDYIRVYLSSISKVDMGDIAEIFGGRGTKNKGIIFLKYSIKEFLVSSRDVLKKHWPYLEDFDMADENYRVKKINPLKVCDGFTLTVIAILGAVWIFQYL